MLFSLFAFCCCCCCSLKSDLSIFSCLFRLIIFFPRGLNKPISFSLFSEALYSKHLVIICSSLVPLPRPLSSSCHTQNPAVLTMLNFIVFDCDTIIYHISIFNTHSSIFSQNKMSFPGNLLNFLKQQRSLHTSRNCVGSLSHPVPELINSCILPSQAVFLVVEITS